MKTFERALAELSSLADKAGIRGGMELHIILRTARDKAELSIAIRAELSEFFETPTPNTLHDTFTVRGFRVRLLS